MDYTEVKLIDIYICNIEPTHGAISFAVREPKNYKYWTFIIGVTPNFITGEKYEEFGQNMASRINRHVLLKYHYPVASETDIATIAELFTPSYL